MVYVSEEVDQLLLSREACIQLGMISSKFPEVGVYKSGEVGAYKTGDVQIAIVIRNCKMYFNYKMYYN